MATTRQAQTGHRVRNGEDRSPVDVEHVARELGGGKARKSEHEAESAAGAHEGASSVVQTDGAVTRDVGLAGAAEVLAEKAEQREIDTAVDAGLGQAEILPAPPHGGENAMELVKYNAAKAALAECADIDECKTWADKAAALEAYGRQVKDEELMNDARRIKARAVRRVGELMREIPPAKRGPKLITLGGKKLDKKLDASVAQRLADAAAETSRANAARLARISQKQATTALQISNLPKEEFEAAVESKKPATLKILAERGRKKRKKKPQADDFVDDGGVKARAQALKEFERWWARWKPHIAKMKDVWFPDVERGAMAIIERLNPKRHR
jgi:hypothetical protein